LVSAARMTGLAKEDAKSKRYDRQIRIWGRDGQRRLETARVCLLGADADGAEAMKNLVLGGVASYTIVDGDEVKPWDLADNFLLDKESLGKSKAECVSRLLQEFSEEVSGKFINERPDQLIASEPGFFKDFTLVLVHGRIGHEVLVSLEKTCRSHGVKLIFGRSYGLFGMVRISAEEHDVIESKPENALLDLRVNRPWKELAEYAGKFDMESLDDMTYKHVPFVVLLLKAAELWKQGHQGALPADRQQQREFKQFVRGLQRSKGEGFVDEGDNFKEAVDNAHYLWGGSSIPSELLEYFGSSSCTPTVDSSDFWIVMAAVKAFVDNGDGALPLPGSIPDMTATTDLYLDLKRLYERKADSDVARVEANVKEILVSLALDKNRISTEYIRLFCKNTSHLKVIKYPTIEEERQSITGSKSTYLKSLLLSEDTAENAFVYILMHACDKFEEINTQQPGIFDSELEADKERLKGIVNSIMSEAGLPTIPLSEEYIHEVCRMGSGGIHSVEAVVGGILAQEAIKLITNQFVPLKGTLVYNAIRGTTLNLGM